jgi:predicted nucleic acid-binding protein
VEVRVALDTNRLSDLMGGDVAVGEELNHCDEVAIPLVVYGEFKSGILGGSRQLDNEAILARFLARPSVRLLLPTQLTADIYAAIQVQLRAQGTPIPTNDIWIAAQALEHGLTLLTRDRHFERIPQLITRS